MRQRAELPPQRRREDGKKLSVAVRIRQLEPEWDRTCADCQTWWFNDDGTLVRRSGGPALRRPLGTIPPCHKCPKQPADLHPNQRRPETANELTPDGRKVLDHYLGCRAVNRFPDDPIVEHHARVIRDVFDLCESASVARVLAHLTRKE